MASPRFSQGVDCRGVAGVGMEYDIVGHRDAVLIAEEGRYQRIADVDLMAFAHRADGCVLADGAGDTRQGIAEQNQPRVGA